MSDDLPCAGCGYNLRSVLVNGQCPECGQAVGDSLFVLVRPDVVGPALRTIGGTYFGFLALFLMLLPVAANWPFIVAFGVVGFLGVIRAISAGELRYRGALESLPIVSTRLRWFFRLAIVDAILAFVASILSWVAARQFVPGGIIDVLLTGALLGWLAFHLLGVFAAGSLGSALATMLWYTFVRWEFIAQRIALGFGVLLLSLAMLTALGTPSNRMGTVVLLVMGVLPMTIALALTAAGLMHVGTGAVGEIDTWEDIIDVDPEGEYARPEDSTRPEPPAIRIDP